MFRTLLLSVLVTAALGFVLEERPPIPDSQIVGGSAVDIRQHPYQLSLQTTGHICGASIISSKWAVTAAHCVGSAPSRYSLRAGSSNKDTGTRYGVKNIIRHPQYNSQTIDYDIALLEIDGEIKFSPTVQPVKLTSAEPSTNKLVDITGWGALREGGSTSSQLMKVSVPIVARNKCQEHYSRYGTITTRMICAGYVQGGKDSCQGDSGGPLTSAGVLYGIVSWGLGCAQPNYPGVYTNVASLRSWISQNARV
ncbi:PREDICTED: trypsin-2-like [Dufourea novaeangliae]|uniref:trypsin-2-like n=1 Tax=Dufourea novaeangliae TaxID=178035 RepID=UPI000767C773|nr:PREDICTED: trypsin-2-like [Dufourea novaeangliae]